MSTRTRAAVSHSTRHGVVSLLGGFVAGYLLFIAIGSSPGDALFSALTLAVLVAAWRVLTQPSL
ncbi:MULTISPECIES: hypothetical protein [Haloarcula]|uniref:Uncharacterized protein n=3 Tax=Haloarcula TaxID=2237 RepID=A0A482T6D1_HALHI|nr:MULTISPECIES: hypothetical protein [Haloarcula]AHB65127.1 hypothetical protein HISP_03570 [Haloarcula hispanica N601]AJF26279.1 hypothetical protein SG26_11325 [Haloarcula sp. CBA1115]EMA20289.1 hypothetical protein C442_11761 [Haloarcula amylolytica JCM 13557]KAA9407906.1 hypothetical protein Har1131_14200 [Haloarcula sp. CBA1131]KAA9409047.1 hypothetical protein EGO51_04310 [Haloarcula hispanica]